MIKSPAARELRDRIAALSGELKGAQAELKRVEEECIHNWGPVEYDPRVRNAYSHQDLMGHFTTNKDGTINAPTVHVPREETPRWSRTCTSCGKTETTTKTDEHVTKTPAFG